MILDRSVVCFDLSVLSDKDNLEGVYYEKVSNTSRHHEEE